jgi:tRNA(adenine34) deaminase
MCAGALYWSKIGRVVYGASDEKNGYRKICPGNLQFDTSLDPWPFHPKTQFTKGVLADDCSTILKEFFRSRR